MSIAGDMFAAGLGLLASTHGAKSGTLTQPDGTALAFTGAVVTRRRRDQHPGALSDVEEIDLTVPSSGISSPPMVDSRIVFTGGSETWLAREVQPITGDPVGWRLRLLNRVRSNEESE